MEQNPRLSAQRRVFVTALVIMAITLPVFLICSAAASAITATISTTPSGDTPLPASTYEQQGMKLMAENDWEGLINLTVEGLGIYPDDVELMCLLAYALRKEGYYQEAVHLLDIAIPLDPRPARYANRGYALLAMRKTSEALADADQAILLNSSYSPGHGLKAETLLATGNLTGALQEADSALTLNPASAHYWHLKGNIQADLGDCPDAISSLERSLSLDADYDPPWPGVPNASVDLARTRVRCKIPVTTPFPAPTKTALLSLTVIAAGAGAFAMKRR